MSLKTIFSFIMWSSVALSAPSGEETRAKSPHGQGTISSFNLGFRFSSMLEKRGVILYRDFQIDPSVSIFFFDDRLEFIGNALSYRDFIYEDKLRARTMVASTSDEPLFPSIKSVKKNSVNRDNSLEWINQLEYFWPGYNDRYQGELDLGYVKDFSAHWGDYLDLQLKVKLFEFTAPLLKMKVEPNFYSSLGWGSRGHNQYFYGPSSGGDGFNNLSYGIWCAFPEEADRFYPVILVRHFEVLGDFRNGEYARGKNQGWEFSFLASYGLLK